jgi:hypothetical protein
MPRTPHAESRLSLRTSTGRARLRALARALGLGRLARRLGLRTAARPKSVGAVRLVPDPVFILSATRSGSTLLRLILNTHSQIRAPHELQMTSFQVSPNRPGHVDKPMREMGLSFRDMENMLWDRVLFGLLESSGKQVIVDKTPQNISDWERIHAYWPQARYIHLRRHPAAILHSRITSLEEQTMERHLRTINTFGRQLNAARAALPGLTVYYEDLTSHPERTCREICAYLGIRWEAQMLDYETGKAAQIVKGLGDFSETVKTGRIRQPLPLPPLEEIPEELRELTTQWGYA